MNPPLLSSALLRLAMLAATLLAMTTSVWGQAAPRPGRLSKEETAALQTGWIATFSAPTASDTPIDARRVRVAALHVPAAMPPSPFVPAGPFVARLQGWLKVPLKGEYTIRLHVRGQATLHINGQQLLMLSGQQAAASQAAKVELVKGYNRIEVMLRSLPSGEATARVNWSSPDFVEEPLPTDLLFSRSDEPLLIASKELRAGRELFATRHCLQCHSLENLSREAKLAVPELAVDAPRLTGVGNRLQEDWLRAWIMQPTKLRPSATMPALLPGDDAEQQQAAADLAAYLLTQRSTEKAADKLPEPGDEVLVAGGKLFENLGCIACHNMQPVSQADPHERLSLHYVKAKFTPGALAAFLQAPQQHYAWSRMPDFHLNQDEAAALASFLTSKSTGEIEAASTPQGSAKRGATLFHSLGCAQCHAISTTEKPPVKAQIVLPTKIVARGCLAQEHAADSKSPDFHWQETEHAALLRFLQSDRQGLMRETPAELSLRHVESLRCTACHRRDGDSSVLSRVLLDESELGLTPEILPALTWTGEKLKPAWSEKLLSGEHAQGARPWLRARMPSFPARAKLLSVGLSHEHGWGVEEDPSPKHNESLVAVGEQLAADNGGLACVKCHAVNTRPALAPFEAPGINLLDAAQRLRYSYYPRWMHDPPRIDVATKMPKFSADGRKTGVATILDGNADKQFEALWHYIQSLPGEAEGK